MDHGKHWLKTMWEYMNLRPSNIVNHWECIDSFLESVYSHIVWDCRGCNYFCIDATHQPSQSSEVIKVTNCQCWITYSSIYKFVMHYYCYTRDLYISKINKSRTNGWDYQSFSTKVRLFLTTAFLFIAKIWNYVHVTLVCL